MKTFKYKRKTYNVMPEVYNCVGCSAKKYKKEGECSAGIAADCTDDDNEDTPNHYPIILLDMNDQESVAEYVAARLEKAS
jgi:hypothetical protein